MNNIILNTIETKFTKKKIPTFGVGDTISVDSIIREGDRKRTQRFTGLVIGIKGSGTRKTFTIRKISYGVGVEKIFPMYSTNIDKIEVVKHGSVRRSKIYYMRDRVGKSAVKVKPGRPVEVVEFAEEAQENLDVQPELAQVEEPATETTAEASSEEVATEQEVVAEAADAETPSEETVA